MKGNAARREPTERRRLGAWVRRKTVSPVLDTKVDFTGKGRLTSVRPWLIGGAIAVIVAMVCLVVVVFPTLRTPQQVAADAAPPSPVPITAKVEKRALDSTLVMRAVVAPGPTVDLKPSDALIAASPVVTGLPAAGAATIEPGTVLIEANGEPIIAMNWPFPAYRDIHAGDTGPDVVQLQKTLSELGYSTGATGVFDAVTRIGVSRLYVDRGYSAKLEAAAGASGASGAATGQNASSGARQGSTASGSIGVTGPQDIYLPARDVLAIPSPSSRLTAVPVHVGQKLGTPDLVLASLDGKASTVVATTTPDRAGRIKVGDSGTLTAGVPAQQYPVKVIAVATSPDDVPGLGQGIRVDLGFVDPAKVAQATPKDNTAKLEVTTSADNVVGLVLPITAIYSTQDGTCYVIPASDPNAHIKVDLGATVDGWVEIKPGSALKEGEDVVLGMRQTG